MSPIASLDPSSPARRRRTLPERMRWPRALGLALGGLAVAGGLAQARAPAAAWGLLLLNSLVWPQLAYWWAMRSAEPHVGERRNLVVDAALGGVWFAAMGFNLLPGMMIMALLAMDCMAVGGPKLMVRGVAGQVIAAAATWGWMAVPPVLLPDMRTVLLCLPFLVAFPLIVGHVNYRLALGLVRSRRQQAQARRLYQATLDAMEAGIVLWDADDRLVLWNASFAELYAPMAGVLRPGLRFEELLRAAMVQGLIPEASADPEAWIAGRLQQHPSPGQPIHREFADGRWRRIVEQKLPDGGWLAFSTDITELMHRRRELVEARQAAERSHQRLQDAIDALPDGFALYDEEDRLAVCNEQYRRIYEQTGHLELGRTFEDLLREGLARGQYPDAAGREEEWLARRLSQHRQPTEPLIQELPGNRWLRIHERRTREGGQAGVRTDITDLIRREQELKKLNEERDRYAVQLQSANRRLERLSGTDALTGLANRRAFDRQLQEEWQRSQRHGIPLSLLMIDVDHFKRFNDAAGHVSGDECLRQVAAALRDCGLRPSDLVARFGGEEFAVLLPHTRLSEALQVAQRCLDAVQSRSHPHPDSPIGPVVTCSIGVADSTGLPSAKGLVEAADEALYQAKEQGRSRAMGAGRRTWLSPA